MCEKGRERKELRKSVCGCVSQHGRVHACVCVCACVRVS